MVSRVASSSWFALSSSAVKLLLSVPILPCTSQAPNSFILLLLLLCIFSILSQVSVFAIFSRWSEINVSVLNSQGNHLSGKPGNVRDFDSCQGNVWDFTESQGSVRKKIFSGKMVKKCLLLAAYLCI